MVTLKQPDARQKYKAWLSSHHFTPTELDNFRRCPIRFFVESVLGVRVERPVELELTAADMGMVVHKVLERFMKKESAALYSTKPLDEIVPSLSTLFEEIFSQESTERQQGIFLQRQKKLILRSLHSFLEIERKAFLDEENLKPRYFEWTFGKDAPPLCLKLNGKELKVSGRIDRIDVNESKKQFLVIDYKTGSSRITGQQILGGDSFQLPLYLLAVRQLLLPDYEPIGGLYYHLSDMTKKEGLFHAGRLPAWLKISRRSSSLIEEEKWDDSFRKILGELEQTWEALTEGRFSPPTLPCPPACPLQSYCLQK